jgi:hypothetical protein
MRLPSPLRGRFAAAALLLVAALVPLAPRYWGTARAAVPSIQGGRDEVASIGLPRLGEVAFEVVGRTDRAGDAVAVAGYLTALAGADPALLFTETDRQSEETARFTFAAELTPATTGQVETVRVLSAAGSLSIYFQTDAGADIADPASFAGGEPIAAFDARTHEIFTERADGTTLVATTVELLQTEALPFAHDGVTYRFGRANALLQLRSSGVATEPEAVSVAAGRAELTAVLGEGAQAIPDEETPEAEETPTEAETPEGPDESPTVAAGDGCELIGPWFAATSSQAEDIQVLAEFILDIESVAELDAGQLRAAADALVVLAEQGREATLPDEAAEVNEEIADATEAIGTAVAAAATAVEDGDEDGFAAAQEDLADALDTFLAALAAGEDLAAACA